MKIQLSDHFTYQKLLRYTLPSVAMMIFTSIYIMVDGFFVSNFAGKTPFTAVNLIYPVVMLMSTIGFMLGNGGTALVAKTMGEGESRRANEYFSLFVYVAFGVGVVLAVLGMFIIRPVAVFLGAEGDLLENSVQYARILLITLPFFVEQILFQSFFAAAEKPQLGFYVTALSGITNMVLDAVLVILLPMEWKLTGAAVASAVAEVVGGVIPVIYFIRPNSSRLRLCATVFHGKAFLQACFNGFSELMTNVAMSLVSLLYNMQLLKYAGENGVAAYGVMMYVSMIFSAAFAGYAMGVAPVISFHFGAENKKELHSLLFQSLTLMFWVGLFMVILAELTANQMAGIFVGYDARLMDMTVYGLRIFAMSFAFMGFGIFISGFFTALNDGITSAIISFLRTMVFECGCVIILPLLLGTNGIWMSVIVAEVMSLALGVFFLWQKQKRFGY